MLGFKTTGGDASMITRTQAAALRIQWKARAGTLKCLHHYLCSERTNPKRPTKKYLCMDCGAGVVRPFEPSMGNQQTISSLNRPVPLFLWQLAYKRDSTLNGFIQILARRVAFINTAIRPILLGCLPQSTIRELGKDNHSTVRPDDAWN